MFFLKLIRIRFLEIKNIFWDIIKKDFLISFLIFAMTLFLIFTVSDFKNEKIVIQKNLQFLYVLISSSLSTIIFTIVSISFNLNFYRISHLGLSGKKMRKLVFTTYFFSLFVGTFTFFNFFSFGIDSALLIFSFSTHLICSLIGFNLGRFISHSVWYQVVFWFLLLTVFSLGILFSVLLVTFGNKMVTELSNIWTFSFLTILLLTISYGLFELTTEKLEVAKLNFFGSNSTNDVKRIFLLIYMRTSETSSSLIMFFLIFIFLFVLKLLFKKIELDQTLIEMFLILPLINSTFLPALILQYKDNMIMNSNIRKFLILTFLVFVLLIHPLISIYVGFLSTFLLDFTFRFELFLLVFLVSILCACAGALARVRSGENFKSAALLGLLFFLIGQLFENVKLF